MKFEDLRTLNQITESLNKVMEANQWDSDLDFNLDVLETSVTLTFSNDNAKSTLNDEFGHLNTVVFRSERDGTFTVMFD
jgi:hypothetical protein